jgi:transcription initiation factor IIE alpha subunit
MALTSVVREKATEIAQGKISTKPTKSEERALKIVSMLSQREMTVPEITAELGLKALNKTNVITLIQQLRAGGVGITWRVEGDESDPEIIRIWRMKGVEYKNRVAVKAKG